MAFVLPNFNLDCNVWHGGVNPRGFPPDATVKCQIRGVNQTSGTNGGGEAGEQTVYFLFPPLTDVRDYSTPTGFDSLECPAGSGRFYYVNGVDDIGKGFTNEHRFAVVSKYPPWPEPIP